MDRYRVDRVLGEGSFGKAILCTRNADNKACVVKQVDASNRNARKTVRREENRAKVKEHGGGVQTRKGHLPRKVDFPRSKPTSLRTRRKPIESPPPDKICTEVPPRICCPPAKGGRTATPAAAAAAKAGGDDATEGPFLSPFARGKDENASLNEAEEKKMLAKRRQAARAVFGSVLEKWQEDDVEAHTPETSGLGLGVGKVTPPAGRQFGLGVDGTWLQALEAKMGAIERQMDQIKTPLFSTLRRRGLGAKNVREGKHDERDDSGEVVIVKYDPKKKMPWKEDASDVEDYLAGRARRPTFLLQVEMRSTPMPPRVKGPKSRDAVGVHQSGIEPFRSASVAPPAELERPCETSSNAIERQQAIRSTPDGERASVRRQQQTQHEGRQVENNDEEGKVAALVEMVGKDPTKRRQELRSFIARARRKCPAEKSDLGVQKVDRVSPV